MALNSELLTKQYSGDGITLNFSFPFKFLDVTDLDVYLVDSAGVETVKAFVTDYDVVGAYSAQSGANDDFSSGATVEFVVAPAVGHTVFIIRNNPDTQDTSFTLNSAFSSAVVEAALDKIVMMIQYVAYRLNRSLRFTDAANIGSFNTALPAPVVANAIVAVNATATGMTWAAGNALAQSYVGTGAIPEETFTIANNQPATNLTNTDYPVSVGFDFTKVRSAEIDLQIYRISSDVELCARGKYLLTNKSTGPDLTCLGFDGDADASSGQPAGVTLSVTSAGVLQYASSNITGTLGQQVVHLRANVMGV